MAVRSTIRRAAAGAFLVLGFAASAPALAATSVRTPDGAVLTVWQAGSGLSYALLGATGTRVEPVPSTGASTQDAYPWLDLDPSSGVPVLIWSRSDGVSLKVAYARFQGDTWTDMHFLTFGSGDHTLPLLATSRDGSFLFYVADGTRYMYAPLDVTSGRLFAAPRHISIGSFQRGADRRTGGSGSMPPAPRVTPDGMTDIPVVLHVCDPSRTNCASPPRIGGGPIPTPPASDGTTDVPIVVSKQQALWSVASIPACQGAALALPDRDLRTLLILRFDGGDMRLITRIAVPTPTPATFGATNAASALASICN